MTTTDGRRRAPRERALGVAVPALGLVLALVLLITSTHLTGASGWYARILVVAFGVVALAGTVIEAAKLARQAPEPATRELGSGRDLLDDVDDVLAAADDEEDAGPSRGRAGLVRVAVVVASVAAMVLLADILGLWLAMIVPVATTLLVLGVRTWWKVVLATALTVAGGYIVFTLLLQVRVPEGILGLL